MMETFIVERFGESAFIIAQVFYYIAFIVIPIFLWMHVWKLWLMWRRGLFNQKQGEVLLEIKVSKDVRKSPAAMELVLENFHQGVGESTWVAKWINGSTRPRFSFEIVSFAGEIHFFVWCQEKWKDNVKFAFYSQYPTAEVFEIEDYAKKFPFDLSKNEVWGCELDMDKPNPYPIKTYIDYGMDKDEEDEFRVDPMNSMLEFLGSLSKDEQVWIQIIIQAHKKDIKKGLFKKVNWKDEGKKIIDELSGAKERREMAKKGDQVVVTDPLSDWRKTALKSIERNLSKHAFNCGIRIMYIPKQGKFNVANLFGMFRSFGQYGAEDMNSLNPARGLSIFNWPWQDFRNIRQNGVKWRILNAYKRRSYFTPPFKSPFMVMSTEELSTIYHIPGETSTTPTLPRVTSRKHEAPANLPK